MEESLILQTTKNAGWNFATNLVTKFGGLIFTIILARMLMPEMFGVYNLVLSIVIIALIFTDAGINNTSIRYLSEKIGKNNLIQARSIFRYLLKIKLILIVVTVLILSLISKFLAVNIFLKPVILIPLLASLVYIATLSFTNFFKSIFVSLKKLKIYFILEVTFEVLKILFVILVFYFLENEFAVAGIFIGMSFAFLVVFILEFFLLGKNRNILFGKTENIENKRISKYISSMTITSVSLVFFGAIDTLMLGRFVSSEYIGYYRVALSFVFAITPLLSFSNVLLPVFTQLNGKIGIAFKKASRYIFILAIPSALGIIVIARYFILAIYGKEYLLATLPLYALAFLILIHPLTDLYSVIFQSAEKANYLSKYVTISLVLNIILNYILIKYLLKFPQEYVVVGVAIATCLSRFFYLMILGIKSKKLFKTQISWIGFSKAMFAGIIMVLFLVMFQFYIDMNIYLGILEILLGAGIYFAVMILIKGVEREDLKLLGGLIKR